MMSDKEIIEAFKREMDGLNKASIQYFLETGEVTGSFAQILIKISNLKSKKK
jgi:hypothetical protein